MSYRINGKFVSKATYDAFHKRSQPNPINFPELVKSQDESLVEAMVTAINYQLEERRRYEMKKRPNGSHTWLRKTVTFMRNNRTFAAFCVALNVEPTDLLNKERIQGARSDLKGLDKVRTLYRYVMGQSNKLPKVDAALFALTIIAANRGLGWISNAQLELVLSDLDINSLPGEIKGPVEAWQVMHVDPVNARQEACRWRTSFENMNAYQMTKETTDDASRSGVLINMESPLIRYLNDRWQLD